ncbi:cytosolic protein [Tenacibaculum holothuriorum]|uniref:Cytosolic protein n=1 Tax=Tenacibaculum holothuriorum TaxID=1635173 RepID=A0A1Y2PFR6_9FLAO|nr:bacillithiol system redox-active protein YtxJ [Tenacibaculum holothuriorum]OSY89346.1 cytosolic protein [Tenacibaculum holothuriorum]
MGILNSIFGSSKKTKEEKQLFINWRPLKSLEQLKEIKAASKKEPILIFKHSTRCGISSMVIRKFEESFTKEMKDLKVYYLDLLSYREISNEVGYEFQVLHQSPQLLVIKNGEAVAHASHYGILEIPLISFVK